MKKWKNTSHIFFLITVALFVFGSCSRIDVAANFADTYIANQLDKYFDINNMQSQFIKKNLKEDIKAIKRILFPLAADELEKILKESEEIKTWEKEHFLAHEKSMKDIFYSALKIFERSAVGFAGQLTPEQLEAFQKEFRDKTDDLKKLVKDQEESAKKRYDKMKKYIEGWIGNLTPEQKNDLLHFSRQNLFPHSEQIKNREKLAAGFAEVFPDLEKRKTYVSELFLHYENLRDPGYGKLIEADQDKMIIFLVRVANKMTQEQRTHLKNTLKDRIQQLRDSAEGKKRRWF